jgi:hypothetical protein
MIIPYPNHVIHFCRDSLYSGLSKKVIFSIISLHER